MNFPRSDGHRGWYKRGSLPHFDAACVYQSITYRLADSLPKAKLDEINRELQIMNPKNMEVERRKKIEKWLDSGHGSCALRNPDHARIVINAWKHFDGERYDLIAWVVMPNHVHVLALIRKGWPLGKILNSWKSYTSRRIDLGAPRSSAVQFGTEVPTSNTGLGVPRSSAAHFGTGVTSSGTGLEAGAPRKDPRKKPKVWQDGYWDRFMRDETHFHNTIAYIDNNPVAAGLVKAAEDWPFGSAGERACRAGARHPQERP